MDPIFLARMDQIWVDWRKAAFHHRFNAVQRQSIQALDPNFDSPPATETYEERYWRVREEVQWRVEYRELEYLSRDRYLANSASLETPDR
jgi:hypothetical protein